ncbi:hypothetical protein ACP4OV_021692 [Aristida adscensionis]
MQSTSRGSQDDGADGGNMLRGNGKQNMIGAPGSWPRIQSSSVIARRRRSPRLRNAAPSWGAPCTLFGYEAIESSHEKRKIAMHQGRDGTFKKMKTSASISPVSESSGSPLSSSSAEEQMISSTKRKLMHRRSYISLFKQPIRAEANDLVVKSANQTSGPAKIKKVKESPFQNLQRLPDGWHGDFDNDHLFSINKLREFWHKSQGAVFIDDKEHVMKTILFILSVSPDVRRPFLLVTTASLPLWEAEFKRFAPCINVVMYDGEKDVRKIIQNPEFQENESSVTSHVLLAHPNVILQDTETVNSIGWEAVIVEYCQCSALGNVNHLKQLSTYFRMVLLTSPLKDNLLEYKNLLGFLSSEEEDYGDYIDDDALVMLKARFSHHVAYERKAITSIFLEHWVPANLSQMQLKLYCSILLANSTILRSQTSTDSIGALRDIMLRLRKCCSHPFLVDELLQHSHASIDDVAELINNSTRASGKLLLLEKMLEEIRKKRSRVIVLFQSDEAGGRSMGDILEKFVRHRFGPESCEHVKRSLAYSRKQQAMTMFNDMTKGRFVFLIENCACLPSIQLSSIDAIIIYDSDWNPLNDLKALQWIKIESQLKYVNIFRLYTPFTVEEKGLVLAKEGILIDNNSHDIISSLSHCLLSWGTSFLFSRLGELQKRNSVSKGYENDAMFMDKVIPEFLTELSAEAEDSDKINSRTISKAYMSGQLYSRNMTLIGERMEVSSLDGDSPHFWVNLLDGKSPCWPDISEPPQVNNMNLQITGAGMSENVGSSPKSLSDARNNGLLPEISIPSSDDLQVLDTRQELGATNLSTPKSLHAELKCKLSKLTKVLELPDDVRSLAEQSLEYLLKNHLVIQKPPGLLHGLNIALCWCAASHLKYNKLDHRASLSLAADCLKYECNEELAGLFYKKFGVLYEIVLRKTGERSSNIENGGVSSLVSPSANLRNDSLFPKQEVDLHGNFANGAPLESSSGAEQSVSHGQELVSAEADREWHLLSEELPNMTVEKRIDLFNSVFSLREKNIHEKQQLELLDLRTHRGNQVSKLKGVCSLVLQHVRRSDTDGETRNDQIKITIQWFTMLLYAFLKHMNLQQAKLEALQYAAWSKEQLMKEKLKAELISGQLDKSFDPCIDLPDYDFCFEEFIHFKKQNDDHHVGESLASACDQLSDDGLLLEITLVRNVVPSDALSTQAARNELVVSCRGSAPVSVDVPENSIHHSPDGTSLQKSFSSSPIPTIHDSIEQDSSDDCRADEHAKEDKITSQRMLPGGPTSLVMEVNATNDGTVAADLLPRESPVLASPQSLSTLSMSREAGTGADQSDVPAQQSTYPPAIQMLATLEHPPAEAELSSNLRTEAARNLQPEVPHSNSVLDQSGHPLETTCVVLDQEHLKSPTLECPQSSAMLPCSSEVETHANLSCMSCQQNTDSPSRHLPAVAETSMLHTQAECGLHPVMQLSDASLQMTQPDDSNQRGCQLESATDISDEGETEHPICTTQNLDAFTLPREDENEDGQAIMPRLQSTSPCVQQSSVTLQHPPEEIEPNGILGLMEADDLQPSALMLGQTVEEEQPVTLGAPAAGDVQPEIQPATRTHDVPFERTDMSGIPRPQNMALQQSLDPTWDTHVGERQAGVSGVVAAHDSQTVIEPSSSMPNQHVDAERTCASGTMAAQDFQPEIGQPLTPVQHMSPERTPPDGRIQIDHPPNVTSGPEHLTQLLPMAPAGSNYFMRSSDPLKNESEKLKHCMDLLKKNHEHKTLQLQTEWKQEMEKLNKKFESLIQNESSRYHQTKVELEATHMRVLMQQSLAENFRDTFIRPSAPQERSGGTPILQALQSSQQAPTRTLGMQTTTSPPALSLGTQPGRISFGSTVPFQQSTPVAQASASEVIQRQSILPRRVTPPLSSVPPQNGSYRAVRMQPHGPAADAQVFRMPSPYARFHRDHHQLPAINPEISSLAQSTPGIFGNFASNIPLAGGSVYSMASGSVQQTMTLNSHPAIPASSLLQGSLPGFVVNFEQSYAHPGPAPAPAPPAAGFMCTGAQIAGVNHPVPAPAPPAAGFMCTGVQIAGVNHPVPESALGTLHSQRWQAGVAVNSMASSSSHQAWATPVNLHPAPPAYPVPPGPRPAAGGPSGTGARGGAPEGLVCLSDDEE